jgi:hypothetical protein
MILLGEESLVEGYLGLFGDSDSVDMRNVHGLWLVYHRLGCRVGRTQWNS